MNINPQKEIFNNCDFSVYTAYYRDMKSDTYCLILTRPQTAQDIQQEYLKSKLQLHGKRKSNKLMFVYDTGIKMV